MSAALARSASEFDTFVAEHGDGRTALTLERQLASAAGRGDQRWFREAARGREPLVRRIHAEAKARGPEGALAIGPCHLAWLSLQALVVRTARASSTATGPAAVGAAIPSDVAALAAEHLNRCEVVKRLPRSPRLIGGATSL
jgi:hypothetical protein